jgi:hypothetical protein
VVNLLACLHGTILPIIFAIVDDVQHVVIAATMSILLLNSKIVSGVPAGPVLRF